MANLLVSSFLVVLVVQTDAQPVTGSITGRVVDAATGEPIVGVRVRLARAPGVLSDVPACSRKHVAVQP